MRRGPTTSFLLLVGIIWITVASIAMGGSTAKRVFGRVQDGDGKPVAGATVVFSSTFGGRWKAETNRKGRYEVGGNLYTSGSQDEKWKVTLEATG